MTASHGFVQKADNRLVLLAKEENQNVWLVLSIFLGLLEFVYCFPHYVFKIKKCSKFPNV